MSKDTIRKPLGLMDLGFFIGETKESSKHIAVLLIYDRPKDAGEDFLEKLVESWSEYKNVTPPYNYKINMFSSTGPCWVEDEDFDVMDHVKIRHMPPNSTRKDLYQLVNILHEPLSDRSGPLWSIELIDDLEDGRFACYFRVHHAVTDGVSGGRLLADAHSKSPDERGREPFWAIAKNYNRKSRRQKLSKMEKASKAISENIKSAVGLGRISTQLGLEAIGLTKNAISLPFTAIPNVMIGNPTAARDFGTTCIPMDRIANIRKITRTTLNHVLLACIDVGIHRYLESIGEPLDGPVTIAMPVSLRKEDAKVSGNRIGIVATRLGDPTDDPILRLRQIGTSLQGIRNQIDDSPASSIQAYTLAATAIAQAAELSNASDKVPGWSHLVVSNVPGPAETLYMEGAKLLEWYPVSTLGPSQRVNVTMFSYDGNLFIGALSSSEFMPNMESMAKYIYEAFEELESYVTSGDLGYSILEEKRKEEE